MAEATPSTLVRRYEDFNVRDFEYRRKQGSKGIALIIRNSQFLSLSNSDPVLDRITSAVRFLGIRDIRISENLKAQEMVNLLAHVGSEYFERIDCLLIFIITHGTEQDVFGVDKVMTYETLKEPLKTVQLRGTPKFMIIQSVPPPENMQLPRLNIYDAMHNISPRLVPQYDANIFGPRQNYPIYEEVDFLLAYCNHNGYDFLEALVDVILRDGRKLEITTTLIRASRIMFYGRGALPDDWGVDRSVRLPRIVSSLTKHFYFY